MKATVDAYDGTVTHVCLRSEAIRSFAPGAPCSGPVPPGIGDARRLCGRTPAIRRLLFRVQAEIYRTFHMRDPEAFYNKEDLWDIAKNVYSQTQAGAKALLRRTWSRHCRANPSRSSC